MGESSLFSLKRGFDRFEKKGHLLIRCDAGDDEPEVAAPGRSRIIDKRRVNAICQQEAVKPLISFFVVKPNRENELRGHPRLFLSRGKTKKIYLL